jgi:signal transduction histidine kinase
VTPAGPDVTDARIGSGTDFVSAASHELRTPITNIKCYADMLAEGVGGKLLPDQLALLQAVSRNNQRLLVLIEDLVTLSRLDDDDGQSEGDLFDLRDVIAGAREALRPMVAGRDLDVAIELPSTPVAVFGHQAQLERAVVNILDNALRFTPDGGVVHLTVVIDDGAAVLTVADSGSGIPAGEQSLLFTRFYRSRATSASAIVGSGLGLTIAKSIVERHLGSIDVQSSQGVGTTVAICLPLDRQLDAGQQPKR